VNYRFFMHILHIVDKTMWVGTSAPTHMVISFGSNRDELDTVMAVQAVCIVGTPCARD